MCSSQYFIQSFQSELHVATVSLITSVPSNDIIVQVSQQLMHLPSFPVVFPRSSKGDSLTQVVLRWGSTLCTADLHITNPINLHVFHIILTLLLCNACLPHTRLCKQESSCEQDDHFPIQCYVQINKTACPLPVSVCSSKVDSPCFSL